MTPESLHDFFIACAGVGGTLIGLLFVAISVEHERLTAADANQLHRVRASAALTSFTNAFAISLFALVPNVGLAWPAFAVSLGGLFFVAASLLSLMRVRRLQHVAPRETLFLVGLVAVFVFQLDSAVRLISRANNVSAARDFAIVVVACFLVGVARSWELIGGPSIGLGGEVTALVRARHRNPATGREPGWEPPRERDER
ncbi:MAG: hypothetical protein JOZ98_09000 [Solirubrobacterales bacterium]|nr:hypothetical protein [Solirubrobacterales bacterium]